MVKTSTTVITLLNYSTTVELEGSRACIESDCERLFSDLIFYFSDRISDLSPLLYFTHSLAFFMLALALVTCGT